MKAALQRSLVARVHWSEAKTEGGNSALRDAADENFLKNQVSDIHFFILWAPETGLKPAFGCFLGHKQIFWF